MIITQTPFRMSFFGGGTDMESFFRENGGAVLSTTFDKYCYVNVRHLPRFFNYSTELSYAKTERVTCVEDIQHPAIRNAMKMLDMHEIRLTYFGRMLDHTWKLKRQTGSAVSTNSIDELYAKGIAAGALGGKLLGAGGGGFLVFYVQPERQDAVRWAMRDLLYIPFQFEDGGTRVIHYTPEDYVPKD